ncbi:MAG: DUF2177 family protein [Hyphomonadaceae bacterium]
MLTYVIAWVVTAAVFLGLDTLWFARMVPRFYRPIMGEIMRPTPNLAAATAFYLIYVSGVVFFAIAPGLEHPDASRAMLNGAILGFFAYATFDLTNHAVMRAWSTKLTLVDMAWGTFATALASGAAYTAAVSLL